MSAVTTKTKGITKTESFSLMRNMLRTSLSTLCYVRNLFDESDFASIEIAGVKLKGLYPTSDGARQLVAWLECGVFDALTRKYLASLELAVEEAETGRVLETYTYAIDYESASVNDVRCADKHAIQANTVALLRKCVVLANTLPALPARRRLTIRLRYTDATPADYEPPLFSAGTSSDEGASSSSEAEAAGAHAQRRLKLNVGRVATPYHALSLLLKAEEKADDEKEEDEKKEAAHDDEQVQRDFWRRLLSHLASVSHVTASSLQKSPLAIPHALAKSCVARLQRAGVLAKTRDPRTNAFEVLKKARLKGVTRVDNSSKD